MRLQNFLLIQKVYLVTQISQIITYYTLQKNCRITTDAFSYGCSIRGYRHYYTYKCLKNRGYRSDTFFYTLPPYFFHSCHNQKSLFSIPSKQRTLTSQKSLSIIPLLLLISWTPLTGFSLSLTHTYSFTREGKGNRWRKQRCR